MSLMGEVAAKALALRMPLTAHVDLTWRCNERCTHCYLPEHTSPGEFTMVEVCAVLDQLEKAGTLFLFLSGGEIFLRHDLLDIVRQARERCFDVKLKTNGTLISEHEAVELARLNVARIDVSLYSDQPDAHDAITCMPSSWQRSVDTVKMLVELGVKTRINHVITRSNEKAYRPLQALADTLGAECKIDPIVTPGMLGAQEPSALRVQRQDLIRIYRDPAVVEDPDKFCAPPARATEEKLDEYVCGAGHSGCYISPTGDVMPCVQWPIVCGNVRQKSFEEIWRHSDQFARIRSMRMRDLPACRECANLDICSRCPGLAMLEGDRLGPSRLDCEKSFARTGILPLPIQA